MKTVTIVRALSRSRLHKGWISHATCLNDEAGRCRDPHRDGPRHLRSADLGAGLRGQRRHRPRQRAVCEPGFDDGPSRRDPVGAGTRRRPAAGRIPVRDLVHEGHPRRGAGRRCRRCSTARRQRVRFPCSSPTTCRSATARSTPRAELQNTAAYNAWIDAFAAGIGSREAVVILEPDGLGIIPWNTDINGNAEWCQPAEARPGDRRERPLRAAQPRGRRVRRAPQRRRLSRRDAQQLARRRGRHGPADQGGGRASRRILRQRVELRADRAAREVQPLDLRLHLSVAEQLVGARLVCEPVLPGHPIRFQHLGSL